jgi:hypothetical protein
MRRAWGLLAQRSACLRPRPCLASSGSGDGWMRCDAVPCAPTHLLSQATTFWQRIRQLQEEDVAVTVRVESVNKGGMLVKFGIYDGFIPVSQFGPVSEPPGAAGAALVTEPPPRGLSTPTHMREARGIPDPKRPTLRTQTPFSFPSLTTILNPFLHVTTFPQSITPDTMEALVGADLLVKFLEVDEVSSFARLG